jgi:hypothetical protein
MTMTKVSVPKMTMTLKTERKWKISLQMGETGRSNHRAITRSLPSTGTGERIDIEYAESVSDLGDDEERILMHDDLNIPSDDDEDEEDMDDESTPKWKFEPLRTC